MKFKNTSNFLTVTLLLPTILFSCAKMSSPLWVSNLPAWEKQKGSEAYIYGAGCGSGSIEDAREEAYNNALAEISAKVSEKIFVIVSEKLKKSKTLHDNETVENYETKIRKSIYKSISASLLQESQVVDSWVSPDGKICLLIAVKKENAIEAAGKAISVVKMYTQTRISEEEIKKAIYNLK